MAACDILAAEVAMLSDDALNLFRLHIARDGNIQADDATRPLYRELSSEGLMVPGHSFTRGREAFYALTDAGKKFAAVLDRGDFASAKAEG